MIILSRDTFVGNCHNLIPTFPRILIFNIMSSSASVSGNSEPVGDLVSPELAEEIIADLQLLFGEIIGVLNRTRLSSFLERIESARGFVRI